MSDAERHTPKAKDLEKKNTLTGSLFCSHATHLYISSSSVLIARGVVIHLHISWPEYSTLPLVGRTHLSPLTAINTSPHPPITASGRVGWYISTLLQKKKSERLRVRASGPWVRNLNLWAFGIPPAFFGISVRYRISLSFSLSCLASWPCVLHFLPRDTKRQFT